MVKYIIGILLLCTFAINHSFIQDVSLQITAPSPAGAGSTVEVEIELFKDRLTGFARFQQELPYGITASPVFPADMNFSFEDNTVRMIWLNLPQDDKITVRYRIHINERLKGDLDLGGTFSYIENNQRRTTEATGMTLAITPSPGIEERLIVDVSEANKRLLAPSPAADPSGTIVAVRQDPVPDNDRGFIVNILINKEDKNHFGKIEEIIPEGYSAAEIESRGGIFSFSDRNARIVWRNLPVERSYLVSYRLIPDRETDETPVISGEFSFMQNEITLSRAVERTDADLVSLTENEKQQLLASLPGTRVRPATAAAETVRPAPPAAAPEVRLAPSAMATDVRPATGPVAEPERLLQYEPGVYYRIQLAAGLRTVDIDRYFGRRDVPGEVRTEIHEGWIKYSVGSYHDYRSARDQRVHIWNTTPIHDAFVTAYNEGTRITVQEALMIANHRWYK